MRLLFPPEVHGVINDNASGLSLLTVPAAAWIEQSALLFVAVGVLLLGVARFSSG
jgi:hypothetical protein